MSDTRQGGNYTQPITYTERWGGPTLITYIAYCGGVEMGRYPTEVEARLRVLECLNDPILPTDETLPTPISRNSAGRSAA
jgi:hypothetical protein